MANLETIAAFVQGQLDKHQIPGAAVAIVKGDQVLLLEGFGVPEIGTLEAVTPETLFQLRSITKSMTAVAVMQLKEQGLSEHYGLGLKVRSTPAHIIYHGGTTEGTTTFMGLLPDQDLGVVVLTNSYGSANQQIGVAILGFLRGQELRGASVDLFRILSWAMLTLAAVGALLLLWLGLTAIAAVRGGLSPLGPWIVAKSLAVPAVAGSLWWVAPRIGASQGLPGAAGLRGWPMDVAWGLGLFLLSLSFWALYLAITLVVRLAGNQG